MAITERRAKREGAIDGWRNEMSSQVNRAVES